MRLHRNIWVVTITSFLTDISSEMVVHVLPMYLRATLGVSMTLIGLIDGMAELTASLVKIVAGRLSDRIRSRKWFAVAGYAVSTIAKPLLLVATSWPIVLAVRCADRVGKGLRHPPRDALVADSADDKARGNDGRGGAYDANPGMDDADGAYSNGTLYVTT
jgi:MFS family permease